MKHTLSVLLALLLLFTFACAEGEVFRVMENSECIATAFSVTEDLLVTSYVGASADTLLSAYGKSFDVSGAAAVADTLIVMKTDTKAKPLCDSISSAVSGAVYIHTATASGTAIVSAQLRDTLSWNGSAAQLVAADAAVLPGSAVVDGKGALVGMLVSGWTEGANTWVMLPVSAMDTLLNTLSEMPAAPSQAPTNGRWLYADEISAAADAGILTISLPSADKGAYAVYVLDSENEHYSWVTVRAQTHTVATLSVVPGRSYTVFAWYSEEENADGDLSTFNGQPVFVRAPIESRFTAFDYHDKQIYLGVLPAGTDEFGSDIAVPVEKVTRELLADSTQALFLQVSSAYSVVDGVSCGLIIELVMPDGSSFHEPGSFIFDPTLQQEDNWHADISGMLTGYHDLYHTYPSGVYTITYYFDNQPVNSLTFTLD